jgi:hypothetical protein
MPTYQELTFDTQNTRSAHSKGQTCRVLNSQKIRENRFVWTTTKFDKYRGSQIMDLNRVVVNKSLHPPPDASVTALACATAAPDAGADLAPI